MARPIDSAAVYCPVVRAVAIGHRDTDEQGNIPDSKLLFVSVMSVLSGLCVFHSKATRYGKAFVPPHRSTFGYLTVRLSTTQVSIGKCLIPAETWNCVRAHQQRTGHTARGCELVDQVDSDSDIPELLSLGVA